MADTIDSLQIEINAKAQNANDAIDRLVGKLDRLTTSLSRVNGTNLNGLANGVQRLGNAMQVMNTIKTADFTRLATNLTRLGTVNVSALNSAASSMSHLTRAFNSLGTVSANAQAVGEMAKNIAKLGNKSVQTAITNIPQLAKAMNNLMATLSRAPRVSQNVIQMTNALANLASQGSKVGTASNSIVRGLNRTSTSANTAKKSFSGLASAIGKFYATYFLVIRGLKGLWSSIESTADYIEAYNYFNVALGKIGSDWSYQFEKYGYDNAESYAESFSTRLSESLGKLSGLQVSIGADGQGLLTESGMKNLGLNIQEITQYASQLASVTNSVGQTGEVSLAVASSFTKLAGDISSLFNVDYSSVSKNLQSGLIGQSRALYKYGIDITNATLQTYAYELGLEKAVSEMTQAEKMQLRMIAILDQSKVAWGDLANTINSPSNMIRQFKNNLKETGMVLGQLFIPLLQKVMPIINGVTIAIKRLFVNIAGFLGIKIDFDAFGQGYSDMEDDIDGVTGSLEDATAAAKELKTTTLGIDELNINAPQDASGSGSSVGGGGIDLTDEIIAATEEYERVWNAAFANMENEAEVFADRITRIFDNIGERLTTGNFKGVGLYISNNIRDALKDIDWQSVYSGASDFGSGFAQFLNGIFNPSMFHEVGSTIAKSLNTAIYAALSFGEDFDFARFGESIAERINGFFEDFDFKALATTLNTWADGIKKSVVTALKKIKWENVLKGALDFLTNIELDTVYVIIGAFLLKYAGNLLTTTIFGNLVRKKLVPEGGLLSFSLGKVLVKIGAVAFILDASFDLGKEIGKLLFPEDSEWYDFGISDLMQAFKDDFEMGFPGMKSMLEAAGDSLSETFSSWWSEFTDLPKQILGGIWGESEEEFGLYDILTGIGNTCTSIFEESTGTVSAIYDDMVKAIALTNEEYLKAQSTVTGGLLVLESSVDATTRNIENSFSSSYDAVIEKTKKMFDDLKKIFKDNPIGISGVAIGGASFVNSKIPAYADGGFPNEYSLFMAGEHGIPELMGTVGGRTAVAGGAEITGIRDAVYQSGQEEAALLREQNELLRRLLSKDLSVNIGDRDIARANARGQRSMGYTLIT